VTEFAAEVELEVAVDQSSLRDARDEVEAAMADVGVSAGTGGGPAPTAGGGLEAIEDDTTDLVTLGETRNVLLRDLVDAQERGNFDSLTRGGGGIGGLLGLGAIGAVGGLGLGLISFLQDFEFEPPTIDPIPVDEPDWIPLPVQDPAPIPYGGPEPIPVEDPTLRIDPTGPPSPADRPTSTPSPTPAPSPAPSPAPDPETFVDPDAPGQTIVGGDVMDRQPASGGGGEGIEIGPGEIIGGAAIGLGGAAAARELVRSGGGGAASPGS
jgi:hypothetical protein